MSGGALTTVDVDAVAAEVAASSRALLQRAGFVVTALPTSATRCQGPPDAPRPGRVPLAAPDVPLVA